MVKLFFIEIEALQNRCDGNKLLMTTLSVFIWNLDAPYYTDKMKSLCQFLIIVAE